MSAASHRRFIRVCSDPGASTSDSGQEYLTDTITFSQYVVIWLSGYYNGKRNNTIIEPDAVKKNEQKVNLYCYQHREVAVMDAVKNVLGFDK